MLLNYVKVVFRGDNWEEVDGSDVFLPRPVRKEILEELLRRARKVFMPPSTLERVSKKVVERYKEKVEVLSMRGRFAEHDPELIAKVAALRKSGLSVRKIAEELDVPKSTVHYILTRMRKLRVGEHEIIL